MTTQQQAPMININGTSADELLAQIINAMVALRKAQQAITDAAPHGRDYQTAPDGAYFRVATAQHRSRLVRLTEISQEIENIGQQICDQRDALNAAKVTKADTTVHDLVAAPLEIVLGGGGDDVG